MAKKSDIEVVERFREHIDELAETHYEGQVEQAFRHVAFQQTAPDPSLSDQQIIELTAIDKSGDLEIDGSFDDDTAEEFFLFQSAGGSTKVDEGKLAKFWGAPQEILTPERLESTANESVLELSKVFEEKLREDYSVRLVFAARAGFAQSARQFASSKHRIERPISLTDGTRITVSITLELEDEESLSGLFDIFKAGLRVEPYEVDFTLTDNMSYSSAKDELKYLRATIRAKELVEVFRRSGMGYRLFLLNPRGPIANAKVNKNIASTLNTKRGRSIFHLLNNGICATCEDFRTTDGVLTAKNFQIVNGCQTTVTLNKRQDAELEETLIDLKLTVAGDEENLAEEIAIASNSQTALKAKDYTSFERQQRRLQSELGSLQPPWYYEIKQGYWKYVLTDKEKARYKTGRRKRHIEVQPLTQAALAFIGEPEIALDRVRQVFQGIRSEEERDLYDRVFPSGVTAQQFLLPWTLLSLVQKETSRVKFASFHIVWLTSLILRSHYDLGKGDYFTRELSSRLVDTNEMWFPGVFRVVNTSCRNAFLRARNILGSEKEMQLRDFFRASRELDTGVVPLQLLQEAAYGELEIEATNKRDPRSTLPG